MNLLESVLPVSENCECCQLTFYNAKTNHKSLQLQVALEWVTILYLRTLTTPVRTSIYLQILSQGSVTVLLSTLTQSGQIWTKPT